jgi:hypothetical protein
MTPFSSAFFAFLRLFVKAVKPDFLLAFFYYYTYDGTELFVFRGKR